MSPQSLADDLLDGVGSSSPAGQQARGDHAGAVEEPSRPRLTVREMQIALEAARSLAGAGPRQHGTVAAHVEGKPRGEGGADRSRAAPCHDALEGDSPMTPPIVAPPAAEAALTLTPSVTPDGAPVTSTPTRPDPWLPEHDGPVSLAGVAAPRARAVRRTAATPDKAARRPAKQASASRRMKTADLDPSLAAAAIAAPPRIVIVGACGGAGATTAAVLLAAALAPVTGVLLLASGTDRGSLSVRTNASGGDVDALAAWTAQHPGEPLQANAPGTATGTAGTEPLVLAAAGRNELGRNFDADTAAALLVGASTTRAAVVLDWSSPAPLPHRVWAGATHVVVTAPATSPGLLDAEYVMQSLQAVMPARTSLSLLTVDVRGRTPRRGGRAALARLHALNVPVTSLPYDPALADHPAVHWPALRPRTRTAVVAALTELLHTDQHRKDPR